MTSTLIGIGVLALFYPIPNTSLFFQEDVGILDFYRMNNHHQVLKQLAMVNGFVMMGAIPAVVFIGYSRSPLFLPFTLSVVSGLGYLFKIYVKTFPSSDSQVGVIFVAAPVVSLVFFLRA